MTLLESTVAVRARTVPVASYTSGHCWMLTVAVWTGTAGGLAAAFG